MNKFCDNNSDSQFDKKENNVDLVNKYYIYLNCSELCYSSMSLVFNEAISQIKTIINGQDKELGFIDNNLNDDELMRDDDDDGGGGINNASETRRIADCSIFIQVLKKYLNQFII